MTVQHTQSNELVTGTKVIVDVAPVSDTCPSLYVGVILSVDDNLVQVNVNQFGKIFINRQKVFIARK